MPQVGEWINGKQWNGSSFGAAGQITVGNDSGKMVSAEVNKQSAAAQGKSADQFQNYLATNMQAPVNVPYSSGANGQYIGSLQGEVEKSRKALEETIKKQKEENDKKMAEYRQKEQETLKQVGELTTPFREELEKTERERLHINKNFEENQKLVDELETLLNQGNDLIRQQSEVTGLAAVRNPRIQKTMDDVAARTGVIEAVMNARNGQIAQAENMIDRSINAITADRQDRLHYYETILELNSRDILSLDSTAKSLAQEEINTARTFLDSAVRNADYFKQLLVNPATATLMGEAGVSLNDSPEQVSAKLAQADYNREVRDVTNKMALSGATPVYDPSSINPSQLVTLTDPRGNPMYFKKEAKPVSTTQSASSFLKALTGAGGSSTSSSLQKPPTGPYKIGATYVDGDGRVWKYEANGWRTL